MIHVYNPDQQTVNRLERQAKLYISYNKQGLGVPQGSILGSVAGGGASGGPGSLLKENFCNMIIFIAYYS